MHRKHMLSRLTIAAFAMFLTSCGMQDSVIVFEKQPTTDIFAADTQPVTTAASKEQNETIFTEPETLPTSETVPVPTGTSAMRQRLESTEVTLYDKMCEVFAQFGLEVTVTGSYDIEDIAKVYGSVLNDHPEFFWMGSGAYTSHVRGDTTTITFDYAEGITESDDLPAMNRTFQQEVQTIVGQAAVAPTLYEKILFIHDYLVRSCDYDQSGERAYTGYGCLIDHQAVCSGYTAAFQTLMHEIGVECGNVSGYTRPSWESGEGHGWNYVLFEGQYCWIDVTWDDPCMDGGTDWGDDWVSHTYFLVSSEQLFKTHRLNEKECVYIPDCQTDSHSYMRMMGYFVETYTFDAIDELMSRGQGMIAVQFANQYDFLQACDDLIDAQRVFDTAYMQEHDLRHYRYSKDNDNWILEIHAET